jgi:5-oxopent-3-ene-1,2,5-tricarboxylate decarboxylase/2-hydroxyhepta-2,4-diene-1,7-dioate isomerase
LAKLANPGSLYSVQEDKNPIEEPLMTIEYRRILLNGYPILTTRDGDRLLTRDGRSIGVDDCVHLPPCNPSKIICIHLNYHSRVDEYITKLPPAPTYFHKPVTAINTHKGDIVRPDRCKWLNYEGEIAIVIDTDSGSMLRVKGSDTLCPIGPGLVTGWDFRNKFIRTYVNGELKQDDNTNNMEWDMHYIVADIARTITLEPGDVLLSGTPANSRPVQPGDVVEVEVEGLGKLTNRIVHGPTPIRDDCGAQPTESEEVISTAMGGDWEHRGKRAAGGQGAQFYKSKLEDE